MTFIATVQVKKEDSQWGDDKFGYFREFTLTAGNHWLAAQKIREFYNYGVITALEAF